MGECDGGAVLGKITKTIVTIVIDEGLCLTDSYPDITNIRLTLCLQRQKFSISFDNLILDVMRLLFG